VITRDPGSIAAIISVPLAQRVEVVNREVRIMGSKSDLLRTLAAISGVKSATGGVRSSVLDWRRVWDSNTSF
jgi:site-specific DNA recombinase